jgi:putative phosphoesterase
MTIIGILSDTHLSVLTDQFRHHCVRAFSRCDVIIHAGDVTDSAILSVFSGKEVIAVSGNMCNFDTQQLLPERQLVTIDGYSIGVTHGAGPRHNITDRVYALFPEADCIVYGHTHRASCDKIGSTMLLNPGSFQGTGKFGASGTYALLTIDDKGLHPSLHNLQGSPP